MRELSPIFKAALLLVAAVGVNLLSTQNVTAKNQHAPQFLGPTPPANDTLKVDVGQHLSFQVLGKDVDVKQPNGSKPQPGDSVTMMSTLLPGLSTMTPALPFKVHMSGGGSTIGSTFNWTPLIADTGLHGITYTLTDNSPGFLNDSRTLYILVRDTTTVPPPPNPCSLAVTGIVTPIICDSGMINLTILNSVDTPFTIMWSTGDTTEDIDTLPAGTYWVTVTDTNNCVATDTFVVDTLDPTILVSPASIIINGVPTLYTGYGPQSATLSIDLDSNSGYVINWFADAVLIDSTSPLIIVSPDTTTTYVVTITDTLNNCYVSDTVTIDVLDISCGSHKVKVCHKGKTICIDTNAVSAHLAHGCSLGECDILGPKMSPGMSGKALDIYPNPSTGDFVVAVPEEVTSSATLNVTDMNGKVIISQPANGSQFLNLHIDNAIKGLYMIQVVDGKGVYRSKVFIQQQ
ncbi:T9SS type A sorting domain-containing protein [Polluticoccus soli]|uniref:T9SS type A sorting domain-containing protein n=1 Tax=Polluticoccus soli TaxID=3034150 RepID=UPI0023E2D340|nr:T9SS type A sorting domain-containing protein [Flavipsychrobacter sp. JY13-12]